MKHPAQEIVRDSDGTFRFRKNEIVRYLLDCGPSDMNHLAIIPFAKEDREQFAQLIGYSVCGFSELSYASDEMVGRAKEECEKMKASEDGMA